MKTLEANETMTFQSVRYGKVSVWNWNDDTLHFTYGKWNDKGWIKLATMQAHNVPADLAIEFAQQFQQ